MAARAARVPACGERLARADAAGGADAIPRWPPIAMRSCFARPIDRYANAWHHREPFWYFLVNVIPVLWLPLTALLPWLVPQVARRRCARAICASRCCCRGSCSSCCSSALSYRQARRLCAAGSAGLRARLRAVSRRSRAATIGAASLCSSCGRGQRGLCAGCGAIWSIRSDKLAELLSHYDIDPLGPLLLMAMAPPSSAPSRGRGAVSWLSPARSQACCSS